MENLYEWSEVARREKCGSGVRWQSEKGGRIVRWHGGRGRNVMKWQFGKGGRVVGRDCGMTFKDKFVLHCSREAKFKQGSLERFDNSYRMFWIKEVTWTLVA